MQKGELPLSKRKKGDKKRKMSGGGGRLTLYRTKRRCDATRHTEFENKNPGCRVIAVIGSDSIRRDHCPVSPRVCRLQYPTRYCITVFNLRVYLSWGLHLGITPIRLYQSILLIQLCEAQRFELLQK
jgi:hypothetical protein